MSRNDRTRETAQGNGVEKARAAWGMLLLTRPSAAARILSGPPPYPRLELPVLRVLGVRHVVQAAFTAARPCPRTVVGGAGLDVLHALTGIGYAASGRSRRRTGLLDATIASGFAFATTMLTPMSPQGEPSSGTTGSGESSAAQRTAVAVLAAGVLGAGGWWLLSRSPAAKSPDRGRTPRPGDPGTLRYRVPDGQDPAVLIAALETAGHASEPDRVAGEHYLTIFCDDLRQDRPHVRSVIERTPESSFSGGDVIHVPVVFEDERHHHVI